MASRVPRHGGLPCRRSGLVSGFIVACQPGPRNLSGRVRLQEFVYGPRGQGSGLAFTVKPGIEFFGKWVFIVRAKERLRELTAFLRAHRIEHEVFEAKVGPLEP